MASPSKDSVGDSSNDASIFASSLVEQVNRDDILSMVYIQRDMLSRFEKTNEMLINFNILSTGRYEATLKDFHKHTQLLYDMKKDLDTIFKRIRVLKQRLSRTYPEAFSACSSVYNLMSAAENSSEEEDQGQGSGVKATLKPEAASSMSAPEPGTQKVTATDVKRKSKKPDEHPSS